MNKNKKMVIASVGVLFILIAAVLLLRNPSQRIGPAPDPPAQAVTTPTPQVSKEYDESHEKVSKIIDKASTAVAEQAPGIWEKVVDTGKWFMGFETKDALILLGFGLFLCVIILGNKNKKSS